MKSMNSKKLYFIGAILLVLVIAMAIVTTNEFASLAQDTSYAANLEIIDANLASKDGYLYDSTANSIGKELITSANATAGDYTTTVVNGETRYHLNSTGYGKLYSSVLAIDTAAKLNGFLRQTSGYTSYAVGILISDIAYDMSGNSPTYTPSNADFTKVLDGNGYTINMTAPNSGTALDNYFNTDYRYVATSRTSADGDYTGYRYTGMICAVNRGTIKNLNIIWDGDLATTAGLAGDNGVLQAPANTNNTEVLGLICGLNYGGTITNCNVTLNCAISMAKNANNSNTGAAYNSAIVGGMVGVLRTGTISRCTLNNNGGVLSTADGSQNGVVAKKALSVAGGITAVIFNDSAARITTCSLTGQGNVIAECGHDKANRNNDGAKGYSGGVTAGAFIISGAGSWGIEPLNYQQIDGIMSSWQGSSAYRWKDSASSNYRISNSASLFGYIGEEEAVKNVVVLFDFLTNSEESGSDLETLDCGNGGGGQVLSYGTWTEIYPENEDGEVNVSFDYSKLDTYTYVRVKTASAVYNQSVQYYTLSGETYTPVNLGTSGFVTGTTYYTKEAGDIIKITAVARDIEVTDEFKNSTVDTDVQLLGKGYFIWALKTFADGWRGADGADAGYEVHATEKLAAEVRMISPSSKGAFIYAFGEVATLGYDDPNGMGFVSNYSGEREKYYDGETFKLPEVYVLRESGEDVAIIDGAYELSITYRHGEAEYANMTASELYLPGTYRIISSITVQGDKYQYYDEENYVLVNYDANNLYIYTIKEDNGTLFKATAESSEVNWLGSDTIRFNYANKIGAIDYYSYRKGSAAAETEKFAMPDDSASVAIEVNESGKVFYQIYAYIVNPKYSGEDNEDEYFKVGTAERRVYVDKSKPVIENVQYWKYDASQTSNYYRGVQILEDQLANWQIGEVVVSFQVKEYSLSGINSGNNYFARQGDPGDQVWTCYVLLTEQDYEKTVNFIDVAGNVATRTFSAKIDTTDLELNEVGILNDGIYWAYYARLLHCPDTVKISFVPVFGASGAYLQYSYKQNAKNNSSPDEWITYNKELKPNQANTFVIDFELVDATFKLRLVSALYGTSYVVYANGSEDGLVSNGVDNYWNVNIKIAGVGITLDNLLYDDGALDGNDQPLGERPLSSYDLDTLFNKSYDASEYADITARVKLYDGEELYGGAQVFYSEVYSLSKPKIQEQYLTVTFRYSNKNAGTRQVVVYVDSISPYYNQYLVRFINSDSTISSLDALINNDSYRYEKELTTVANIGKRNLVVDLFDYESQFINSTTEVAHNAGSKTFNYSYGDNIPSQITITGLSGEDILLALISDAITPKKEIGTYSLTAAFADDNVENYNLTVGTDYKITIAQKLVDVELVLVGEGADFSTTITFDGKDHSIVGTYLDVDGKKVSAVIKYYMKVEGEMEYMGDDTAAIKDIGEYNAEIIISDQNYAPKNDRNPIFLKIDKGYLELVLTKQTKSFTSNKIAYAIESKDKIDKSLYDNDNTRFDIKYYPIINDVIQNAALSDAPRNVGRYAVSISYKGNDYFSASSRYETTELEIIKAVTVIEVADIEVPFVTGVTYTFDKSTLDNQVEDSHDYNIAKTTFTVKTTDGNVSVMLIDENELSYTNYYATEPEEIKGAGAMSLLKLSYKAEGEAYSLITNESIAEFENAGNYTIKVDFMGDDCYEPATYEFAFVVVPAKYEDLTFEGATRTYGDPDEPIYVGGPNLDYYISCGAKITYTVKGQPTVWEYSEGVDLEEYPFTFVEVGTYELYAKIELENYETKTLGATIVIKKVEMPRIIPAIPNSFVYTGTFHPAEFKMQSDQYDMEVYYLEGYEKYKWIEYIEIIDKETNNRKKVTVHYGDDATPIDVGTYEDLIEFKSDSYEDQPITVRVTITPVVIQDGDIDFSALEGVYSSTDLRNYKPKFTDVNGNTASAKFVYFDTAGNEVQLNENGSLDPGEYVVRVQFTDRNYFSDDSRLLTIGAAAEDDNGNGNKGGSIDIKGIVNKYMLYIIIAGAVLGVAIIGIVVGVAVKAKKGGKRGKRAGRPRPAPKGKPRAPEQKRPEAPVKKRPEEPVKKKPDEPVKKTTDTGPADKAQF